MVCFMMNELQHHSNIEEEEESRHYLRYIILLEKKWQKTKQFFHNIFLFSIKVVIK